MVKSYSTVGITEDMNFRNRNKACKINESESETSCTNRFHLYDTPDPAALPSKPPFHPPSAQKSPVRSMTNSVVESMLFNGANHISVI